VVAGQTFLKSAFIKPLVGLGNWIKAIIGNSFINDVLYETIILTKLNLSLDTTAVRKQSSSKLWQAIRELGSLQFHNQQIKVL
jgi:hypothetical protein